MNKSIKKTYQWKTLTEDGLLKEPKDLDYGYASLNDWGSGFDNEEEAHTRLLELSTSYYAEDLDNNLVLVTIYNIVDED